MSPRIFNLPLVTYPWRHCACLGAVALASTCAFGQNQGQNQAAGTYNALRFLGRLNRPAVLEPAGSRGSLGADIGAGAGIDQAPEDSAVLRAELRESATANTGSVAMPHVWIRKGLPWPVDFGLVAGQMAPGVTGGGGGTAISQVAGDVQWTVFEGLSLPALSLRGSYGRLYGATSTTLTSTGATAVVSYGFLRYITAYLNGGITRHQGSMTIAADNGLGCLLTGSESGGRIDKTWTETTRAAGLRVVVVPPFVAVTAEAGMEPEGERSYAAKLSVGM